MAVPLDLLARDADMIYSITDLLGMHSSILAHYASQQGLPPPDLGDLHYTLRRILSLALERAYAARMNAVRLYFLFIFLRLTVLFFTPFSGLSLSRAANCSFRCGSSLSI